MLSFVLTGCRHFVYLFSTKITLETDHSSCYPPGGFSDLGCRCSGFYMLDIIIFCRAFSGFNLHIVCIKFLREAFRYDYPGWVFFFFLISYFSASFSSVFIYHFFNCFLNLFGFSVLSSSGMML